MGLLVCCLLCLFACLFVILVHFSTQSMGLAPPSAKRSVRPAPLATLAPASPQAALHRQPPSKAVPPADIGTVGGSDPFPEKKVRFHPNSQLISGEKNTCCHNVVRGKAIEQLVLANSGCACSSSQLTHSADKLRNPVAIQAGRPSQNTLERLLPGKDWPFFFAFAIHAT